MKRPFGIKPLYSVKIENWGKWSKQIPIVGPSQMYVSSVADDVAQDAKEMAEVYLFLSGINGFRASP